MNRDNQLRYLEQLYADIEDGKATLVEVVVDQSFEGTTTTFVAKEFKPRHPYQYQVPQQQLFPTHTYITGITS